MDGQVFRLEPKVAEVCAHLAERPGEVVRKEELLRAVWPDTFVTDDVLTKAISELRKIDPSFTMPTLGRDKRGSDDPIYNAQTDRIIEGLRKAVLSEK